MRASVCDTSGACVRTCASVLRACGLVQTPFTGQNWYWDQNLGQGSVLLLFAKPVGALAEVVDITGLADRRPLRAFERAGLAQL